MYWQQWEIDLLGENYEKYSNWKPSPHNNREVDKTPFQKLENFSGLYHWHFCVSYYSPCGTMRLSNHWSTGRWHSNKMLCLFEKKGERIWFPIRELPVKMNVNTCVLWRGRRTPFEIIQLESTHTLTPA